MREATDGRVHSPENVAYIVSYLLRIGLAHRNAEYAVHAKKVVVYIGRTGGTPLVTDDEHGRAARHTTLGVAFPCATLITWPSRSVCNPKHLAFPCANPEHLAFPCSRAQP